MSPGRGNAAGAGAALLDRHLPRFHFAERHALTLAAPPDRVWRALLELDLGESWVVRTLFRLRGLPPSALRLDGLEELGFVRLGELPGREIAFGLAGRFWTPGGDLQRLDPAAFDAFARPGFAKAVWSFRLRPAGSGTTRAETETRILCLDPGSHRRFRLYWLVVRPFSGWIRLLALELLARRAEAPRQGP